MADPDRIADSLLRGVRKANRRYDLLAANDHLAVGASGGKDSETLLRLLARWQAFAPFPYHLTAIHITTPNIRSDAAELAGRIQELCGLLHVGCFIRPLELTADEPDPLDCFRCSWNRRRSLFFAAREIGCNKVALGHHADDIAVTALLNLFYHGRLESMAPRRTMFEGLLTIVRPLALLEEKDIIYYARAAGFWRQSPCCPQGADSQRAFVHSVLRTVKKSIPKAQINLFNAVEQLAGWQAAYPVEPGAPGEPPVS